MSQSLNGYTFKNNANGWTHNAFNKIILRENKLFTFKIKIVCMPNNTDIAIGVADYSKFKGNTDIHNNKHALNYSVNQVEVGYISPNGFKEGRGFTQG